MEDTPVHTSTSESDVRDSYELSSEGSEVEGDEVCDLFRNTRFRAMPYQCEPLQSPETDSVLQLEDVGHFLCLEVCRNSTSW